MTTKQARKIFDQIIAAHITAGNRDQAARIEIAREYFTNPECRKAIEDAAWNINTKHSD